MRPKEAHEHIYFVQHPGKYLITTLLSFRRCSHGRGDAIRSSREIKRGTKSRGDQTDDGDDDESVAKLER